MAFFSTNKTQPSPDKISPSKVQPGADQDSQELYKSNVEQKPAISQPHVPTQKAPEMVTLPPGELERIEAISATQEELPMTRIAGGELAQAEAVSTKIADFLNSAVAYLTKRGATTQQAMSFLLSNQGYLKEAGFSDKEIKDYLFMIESGYPSEQYDMKIMGVDPDASKDKDTQIYSPKDFWELSFPEREEIRKSGRIWQYFPKEESGTIESYTPPEGIMGQIYENIQSAIHSGGDRIEKFDKILHAFDPILEPAAYYTYKLVNGKVLYSGDILYNALNRIHQREFGEPLSRKNLDEGILWAMDYHPSEFTRNVADIVEFSAALSSGRGLAGGKLIGKAPLLSKLHTAGLTFAIPEAAKGTAEVIADPNISIGPAGATIASQAAKGYLTGAGLEAISVGIPAAGRTKPVQKAMDTSRLYWKKIIDYPINKIKQWSDSSLAGRFRDVVGNTIVPFYKRPKTFIGRMLRRRGNIKINEYEVRSLISKFNRITKNLEGWSNNPESFRLLNAIYQGKESINKIPKELRPWLKEAQEMGRQHSLELAEYFRKIGREKMAKSIEKKAGYYLPRKFTQYEKGGLVSKFGKAFKKPTIGGGQFKMRKDAWTIWEGKKPVGKHTNLDGAIEHLRNAAEKTYKDKIKTYTDKIEDIRSRLKSTSKYAEQKSTLNNQLNSLLKKRKSLYSKKSRQLLKLDKQLTKAKETFTGPPETLPRPKEIKISFAGHSFSLKPPLSQEELQQLGEITDTRYLLASALTEGKADIENMKLLDYVAQKWGQKISGNLTAKEVQNWAEANMLDRIPNNVEKYGRLAGMCVPKEMAADIKTLIEPKTPLWMKIYRPYLKLWKESHIIWNPATHNRNILGNTMFADFAGNSVWNIENYPYYRQALDEILKKGKAYKELIKYNVIGTEYYGADIKEIASKAVDSESFITALLTRTRAKAGEIYAAEDQIYKMAAYLKYRAQGMTASRAAAEVNKWFPNYEFISPISRWLKDNPLGAPFISFTDQALKISGRAVREHPIKVLKWASLPGLLTEFSQAYLGMSPQERDVVDSNRNYFEPLTPFRDKQGRVLSWDLRWTIPLANDIAPTLRGLGIRPPWMLSGPFFDAAVSLVSGIDPFTGQAVTEKDATLGKKILDHAVQLSKELAPVPSIAQYGWKRLGRAMEGGGRENLARAIAGVIAGINVRAPYIARQKLFTDIRDDMFSGTEQGVRDAILKIVIFNETYRSPNQPRITPEGLTASFVHHLRKELTEQVNQKIQKEAEK